MKSQTMPHVLLMPFLFLIFLLSGFGCVTAGGGKPHADSVAIKGYDTVAYFNAANALKGNESYTFKWHDLIWYFSSPENRDLFAAAPDKYAAQYDGNCSWAMTEARKYQADPEVWKIVDGKLYLNCSQSAYEMWSRDIPGNINKADANWMKFSGGN